MLWPAFMTTIVTAIVTTIVTAIVTGFHVQINEDGLGAYLPGALRKKLMRM